MRISNCDKYFTRIAMLLNKSIVNSPKNKKALIKINHNGDNDIIGWEIDDKIIQFNDGNKIKVDEKALLNRGKGVFCIDEFSYHFECIDDCLCFRVDYNPTQDLHFHTHPTIHAKRKEERKHYSTAQTRLNINTLNAANMVEMCMECRSTRKYPFHDDNVDSYNRLLKSC